jgi:hypothetical protein
MAKAKSETNGRKRSKDPRENQAEAMRQVVEIAGIDAPIPDIQKLLLEKFGHKMDANMVSSYRSSLRRKMETAGGGKPRRRRRRRRGRKPGTTTAAPTSTAAKGEDLLKDLRVMKDMAARLGPRRFRDLVGFVVD